MHLWRLRVADLLTDLPQDHADRTMYDGDKAMTNSARIYRNLPANERQEFRIQTLLKEHLHRAAAQSGQTVSEYITDALADRVTADLVASNEWVLSVDEQAELMKILLHSPTATSARARKAAKRADVLFGPLERRHR